ncbi:hypothetical protein DM02DRAFT_645539 [Periconia macrospinosa]|uniref:Zn(2)-C6 fungal-type domain-containing protein n=1 Tax=Periconia macrospinosa TaxID=97972 RepID=A0A2V1DD65_9PLEO|nr:hypothetical protein DM02DRAFT_645539 [Periconia macrospinosa]
MESNIQNLDLYAFDPNYDNNQRAYNGLLANSTWPLPLSPQAMNHHHHHAHSQNPQQTQPQQSHAQQSQNNAMANANNNHAQRRVNTVAATTAAANTNTANLNFTNAMSANPMLNEWINLSAAGNFSPSAYDTMGMSTADFTTSFGAPLQASPVDFGINTSQAMMTSMSMNAPFNMMTTSMDLTQHMATAPFGMSDFQHDFSNMSNAQDFTTSTAAASAGSASVGSGSPTEQWMEVRSLKSSSDNGWSMIETGHHRNSYDLSNDPAANLIFNPAQSLSLSMHIRADSDSSHYSDVPRSAGSLSSSSFEEIQFPMNSPQSEVENTLEHVHSHHSSCHHGLPMDNHDFSNYISPNQSVSPPMARVEPVEIKPSPSLSSSPTSSAMSSPPARRRKSPAGTTAPVGAKPAKNIAKKTQAHSTKKDAQGEKRVGKRRGPLGPQQRQRAHEIRKLRACLRCKFLKKTCDKGDPCGGCQPSHARLWQVPCTRIDIKDIGYFMKDWKADYERHVSLGFSIGNIKGFSPHERPIYITHGYGHYLPIMAREVYVRDEKCFGVDWHESLNGLSFEINTAKLSAGMEGVSRGMLSEYLDRHIDGGFEAFVDEYFEGTYFVTEILKTAYRFYCREKLPVIRKALKLVVAYNLTMHVTMVEGLGDEGQNQGKVEDQQSKFCNKTIAPVMINFQVKCALADMWRELQKDVLEELSALYSSVYSGDKLKNWPTIFMLAGILLAVWELMQFDCSYRVPDQAAVSKFCNDMESTPVGVIVGLFSAISQKLPAFTEWDTRKHHHLLNSNPAVCDAMTEVRAHVTKYETYLRSRSDCKFDRNDFDSLSNKFLSKLVIRAN